MKMVIKRERLLKNKKGRGGRRKISKEIPREQVKLDLTGEEKEGAIDTFYTVVKEKPGIVPTKLRALEYLREKTVVIDDDK